MTKRKGASLSWAELFTRYRRWCNEQSATAMTAEQFGQRLEALRAEGVLRTRVEGEDVYCLDVKRVA